MKKEERNRNKYNKTHFTTKIVQHTNMTKNRNKANGPHLHNLGKKSEKCPTYLKTLT
jgi:hypothetical protein